MIGDYEAKLLDDHADDFYGLWEFDWQLNTDGYEEDRQKRVVLLRALVGAGLIEVYFGVFRERVDPLPPEDALKAIGDATNWQSRKDAGQKVYFLVTSAAGEEVLRERAASR